MPYRRCGLVFYDWAGSSASPLRDKSPCMAALDRTRSYRPIAWSASSGQERGAGCMRDAVAIKRVHHALTVTSRQSCWSLRGHFIWINRCEDEREPFKATMENQDADDVNLRQMIGLNNPQLVTNPPASGAWYVFC